MAKYDLNLSGVSDLFKIKYDKLSEATMNVSHPTFSQIRTRNDFDGKQRDITVPLSFGGSVGSGTLPTAGVAEWDTATLTRKKVYGRLEIDRETIYAASTDSGAFVRRTREYVRKVVESYSRNLSRILFGHGDGSLGVVASSGVSGSNPYTITIKDDPTSSGDVFTPANFEESDFVNFGSSTDLFDVTAVDTTNKTITVNRISGSTIPADADTIYMQGSKDNDPHGLDQVCDATSGSLYGIPVGRRWQSFQKDASAGGPTPDLLNEAILQMVENHGKQPNMIVASYTQYRKLLNQLEDQKRYVMKPRNKEFRGMTSFTGLEHFGPTGPIPIMPDRFVPKDRIYLLNTDKIVWHRSPGFGWFDDDGTVLLRSATSDSYEARYGGYMQLLIHPLFQGRIKNLAV